VKDTNFLKGILEEYSKFYDENGYLPHKAADDVILIAVELLEELTRLAGIGQ